MKWKAGLAALPVRGLLVCVVVASGPRCVLAEVDSMETCPASRSPPRLLASAGCSLALSLGFLGARDGLCPALRRENRLEAFPERCTVQTLLNGALRGRGAGTGTTSARVLEREGPGRGHLPAGTLENVLGPGQLLGTFTGRPLARCLMSTC